MTLQQLRYIVALDDERHFGRAAERCAVSQPGLTIQLKKLEEAIGIQIFNRSTTPLSPTGKGKEIIDKARVILEDVDAIRNFIVDSKNELAGTFKLGIVSTLAPYLIPLIMKPLRTALPAIRFEIVEKSTVDLINSLQQGTLDIALMATPTGRDRLREFPVFYEEFIGYFHPTLKPSATNIQVDMLDLENLLLLQEEYCYNSQLLAICDLKSPVTQERSFHFGVSSITTLKNLVRAKAGFAFIPSLATIHETNDAYLLRFPEPRPVREISLVVSKNFTKTAALEKMKESIWNALPPSLRQGTTFTKIRWDDAPYFRQKTKEL